MALTSSFNFQEKTRNELQGMYSELFNQVANRNIRKQQRKVLYGALQRLRYELGLFVI